MLITGRETLFYEHYFQDEWHADSRHNLTSGIKSIISTLVGIALQKQIQYSFDQKIADFFPEHIHDQTNPKIFQVSFRHLLTMTSGFEFSRHAADQAIQRGEWMKFLFNKQVAHQPGAEFAYKPNSLTLSHILMKVSGKTTAEFAQEHLFSPLGITDFDWDDINWSSFYPRDLPKLARLYLNNGRWKG